MTGRTENNGTKNMVTTEISEQIWRALEMPLINCEINLILTWSAYYILMSGGTDNQVSTFTIT